MSKERKVYAASLDRRGVRYSVQCTAYEYSERTADGGRWTVDGGRRTGVRMVPRKGIGGSGGWEWGVSVRRGLGELGIGDPGRCVTSRSRVMSCLPSLPKPSPPKTPLYPSSCPRTTRRSDRDDHAHSHHGAERQELGGKRRRG